MNSKTDIIRRIESIREMRGISRTEMARRCNRTYAWYYGMLSGRRGVSMKNLEPLSLALDVDITDFFKEEVSESHTSKSKSKRLVSAAKE